MDLIEYICLRFCAVTLLLGCLRSEQFNRFREGGLEAVEWIRNNLDRDERIRPVVVSVSRACFLHRIFPPDLYLARDVLVQK